MYNNEAYKPNIKKLISEKYKRIDTLEQDLKDLIVEQLSWVQENTQFTLQADVVYQDGGQWQKHLHREIFRALSRIEEQRVVKALVGEQDNRFAQFDLINNFRYTSSKQEVKVNQQITFSDDELDARLANLERKTQQLEDRQDQDVIDITPQPSLLE